jgi:hypothetical protein
MTFKHIIIQNLKFNTKRFLSYLFVNSFVIAVLFLYGSLLFNEILAQDVAMKLAKSYIDAAAYAIVIFSIVFVTYTGIYFVKSRGKEFGVYLTLGMTTRDLTKMILLENLVIVAFSATCGLVSGVLISKLFYLVLGKILDVSTSIYHISYKTFILSLGIFAIVFLCNLVFTSNFLRNLSIMQITKSASTRGVSKPRPTLGILAIIIFIASLWLYHAAITGEDFIKEFVRNHSIQTMIMLVLGIFGSLYFMIAFFIESIRMILKCIPSIYNKYILILSNLSHRFFAYKVSLYMVSLLITLAIFFMGFGLSFYSFTEKTIDEYEPFDYMVETSNNINNITGYELQKLVSDNGGTLKSFSDLEYISDMNYRNTPERFLYFSIRSMLISESEFNQHMGLSLDIDPDELMIAYNEKGKEESIIDYDTVVTLEPWSKGMDRAAAFRKDPISMNQFIASIGNTEHLIFKQSKTRAIYSNFINSYGNVEFAGAMANIVDDSVYEKIKAQRDIAYLFNLKSGDGDRIFTALLDALREKNNSDTTLWSSSEIQFGYRDNVESLRPIYKAERFKIASRIGDFLLFAMSFLGALFLLSSSIVLYYKVATDIDEEKEQAILLTKIGLTMKEYKAYLGKHLAIIFFAPMFIGGVLGLFLINSTLSFTVYSSYLMNRVIIMYCIFVAFDILFYMSLKKKFLKSIGLYL